MGVRVTEEAGRWYLVEYHGGRRALHRSFGRGPQAKLMAEEAKGEIDTDRRRVALGLTRPGARVEFAGFAQRWLEEVVVPHKASGTARNYAQLLRDHLLPAFGALALADITPQRVQAFIARKLAEANPKRRGGAGHRKARNTVRNMAAVLRALLNHAVDVEGCLTQNPAERFGKRYFGGAANARGLGVEVYDEGELAQLLRTAARYYPEAELYIRTLVYTGLRVGELLGLQWGDVDFQGGFVIVRRSVKVSQGRLLVEETKTHRVRAVDLPDTLLRRWRELRSIREAEAAVVGRALSRWCCPSRRAPAARPLNASWLNAKVWARVCHHAGLRRLRVHDLRHTYASLQLRAGTPMEYVQRQLGHEKIDTTIRLYAHFKAGAGRAYANDLATRIEQGEPERSAEPPRPAAGMPRDPAPPETRVPAAPKAPVDVPRDSESPENHPESTQAKLRRHATD